MSKFAIINLRTICTVLLISAAICSITITLMSPSYTYGLYINNQATRAFEDQVRMRVTDNSELSDDVEPAQAVILLTQVRLDVFSTLFIAIYSLSMYMSAVVQKTVAAAGTARLFWCGRV